MANSKSFHIFNTYVKLRICTYKVSVLYIKCTERIHLALLDILSLWRWVIQELHQFTPSHWVEVCLYSVLVSLKGKYRLGA